MMISIVFFFFFFFFYIVTTTATTSVYASVAEAEALLAKREASLARLVQTAEQLEATRCSRLSSYKPDPSTCAVAACGSSFPSRFGFSCNPNYGADPACGCNNGLIRSVNKSTLIFAPKTKFDDPNVFAFIANDREQTEAMAKERDAGVKAWMGVGHYKGAFRGFVGAPRKRSTAGCDTYDPRSRPWFISASSGPKDVVLVIDTSGSMSDSDCSTCKTRMQHAIEAGTAMLDTLTFNDYYAIITFSSSASTSMTGPTLLQGTSSNLKTTAAALAKMVPKGGTNFSAGFGAAFSLLRGAKERSSHCQKIILFLSDGTPSDTGFMSVIEQQQAQLAQNATIITYSQGAKADTTWLRKIACANGGIWQSVGTSGESITDALISYTRFLSLALDSTVPRWVEPYVDAFGMGRMTTVSRPVYDRSVAVHGNSSGVFMGVANIDVPLAELTGFVSESQLLKIITSRGALCVTANITWCELQQLRRESGYECPSAAGQPSAAECSSVTERVSCDSTTIKSLNDMLCDPLQPVDMLSKNNPLAYPDVSCCPGCGGGAGALPGIVAGVAGGLLVIGLVVCAILYWRKWRTSAGSLPQPQQQQEDSASVNTTDYAQYEMSHQQQPPPPPPPATYGQPAAAGMMPASPTFYPPPAPVAPPVGQAIEPPAQYGIMY